RIQLGRRIGVRIILVVIIKAANIETLAADIGIVAQIAYIRQGNGLGYRKAADQLIGKFRLQVKAGQGIVVVALSFVESGGTVGKACKLRIVVVNSIRQEMQRSLRVVVPLGIKQQVLGIEIVRCPAFGNGIRRTDL